MERVEATELESCLRSGLRYFSIRIRGRRTRAAFPGAFAAGKRTLSNPRLLPSAPACSPVRQGMHHPVCARGRSLGVSVSFVEELQGVRATGSDVVAARSGPGSGSASRARSGGPGDLYDSGGSMPERF